jgi:hypothetical protein
MYRQEGDELKIQYFSNHFGDYRLISLQVKVLNDTMLLVKHKNSPYFSSSPHVIDEDRGEIYRFKQFSIKPDSSNNYIRDHLDKFQRNKIVK